MEKMRLMGERRRRTLILLAAAPVTGSPGLARRQSRSGSGIAGRLGWHIGPSCIIADSLIDLFRPVDRLFINYQLIHS
jgi:hypothetical protein